MNGQIIKIVKDKGFGFIKGEDGYDYFFHSSGLLNSNFDDLTLGIKVTFAPTTAQKGLRAEGIEV